MQRDGIVDGAADSPFSEGLKHGVAIGHSNGIDMVTMFAGAVLAREQDAFNCGELFAVTGSGFASP